MSNHQQCPEIQCNACGEIFPDGGELECPFCDSDDLNFEYGEDAGMSESHPLSDTHSVKRLPAGHIHIYATTRVVAIRDRLLVGVALDDEEMAALVEWWKEQEEET
jgi:hypothetical protein